MLPDNYASALRRLYSIEHKFQRNPLYAEKYSSVINDYIDKGFARPLKQSKLLGTLGRNWYLPHHGVVNPMKPDKMAL